jgi:RimJ/RimL family protein N-acetyltransferase
MMLRESRPDELEIFCRMEQDADIADFILPYTLQQHIAEYLRQETLYLSIVDGESLLGFFILALDPDQVSVEFRRIVVAERQLGTGQRAILAMERYCRDRIHRSRIWLDVFAANQRGIHVYEKLGYSRFDEGELHGKPLLYYHRHLPPS